MLTFFVATIALAQSTPKSLAVETWDFGQAGGKTVSSKLGQPSIEFFVDEKKVAGTGGVNRFSGPAVFNGRKIKIGPLVSTKMAGSRDAMEQEDRVLKAVQSADRWRFSKGRLELLAGKLKVASLFRHRVKK